MTPEAKAKELIDKFQSISGHKRFSKGYALICVDEILESPKGYKPKPLSLECFYEYWNEVKQEIENK